MATPHLAKLALKYGPVAYTLALKYGPQVTEQLLKKGSPARQLVYDQTAKIRSRARKLALAHADTVVDGSLQQAFHGGDFYWVVFSRNEPVGTHPHTNIPYDTLLLNADPTKRQRPEELRRTIHLPKRPRR